MYHYSSICNGHFLWSCCLVETEIQESGFAFFTTYSLMRNVLCTLSYTELIFFLMTEGKASSETLSCGN
jgi:hypothetical protein